MKKMVDLYIGDLSKSDVIKAIYDDKREREINFIYSKLQNYNTRVQKEDLIPNLSEEELESLCNKDNIDCVNGITMKITFLENETLRYDEDWSSDCLYIIFHLKDQKGLFQGEEYQELLQELAQINATINRLTIELLTVKEKKNRLRPIVEGKDANPSKEEKDEFELFGKQKWQIENEMMENELQKRIIMKQLLHMETIRTWDNRKR